ncbi:DUF4405 domain-containing protein [Desulfobulbus propionicus]
MTRQTTSLILVFSGLVLLVTSLVLYLGPAGQVGHFSPWSFWGLGRHHWGVLHLNAGLLFCIAMLLHTALNWKALVRYVQRLQPHWSLSPLLLSITLTIYVCLGGSYDLPPMKQCIDIARSCRLDSVKKYGSPPYGTASHFPVAQIAMYMGWDPKESIKQLNEHHIVVQSPQQSLADLARENRTTIGHLLDTMQTH